MSLNSITNDRASGAIILIRLYVGAIFGPGRFAKIGLPAGDLLANLDGVLEIGCGLLILVGLATRLATMPVIADMLGAIVLTKPCHSTSSSLGGDTLTHQLPASPPPLPKLAVRESGGVIEVFAPP